MLKRFFHKVTSRIKNNKKISKSSFDRVMSNNFSLINKKVSDTYTERSEIIAIHLDATFEEVRKLFIKHRFSRILVYSESLDEYH